MFFGDIGRPSEESKQNWPEPGYGDVLEGEKLDRLDSALKKSAAKQTTPEIIRVREASEQLPPPIDALGPAWAPEQSLHTPVTEPNLANRTEELNANKQTAVNTENIDAKLEDLRDFIQNDGIPNAQKTETEKVDDTIESFL